MISSSVVSKIGFYQPFLIIGGAILVISGGLICTFDVQSSIGKDIGYQTLLGIGFGLVVQIPPIVVGAVSADEDKAIALGGVLGKHSREHVCDAEELIGKKKPSSTQLR